MNIEILSRPFTAEQNYFIAGVQDITTTRQNVFTSPYSLAANLDSIQSQLIWAFRSEVLGTSGYSEIFIDLTGDPIITEIQIFNEILTPSVDANLEYNQFYPNGIVGISISDRVDSICNIINTNINLNWKYTAINDSGNKVHIIANNTGTIYNLTAPNFSIITDPPLPLITTGYVAGIDGSRGEKLQNYNYKCFVEVWEVDNVDWLRIGSPSNLTGERKRKLTTLTQNWNSENIFNFDISNFFNVNVEIDTAFTANIFNETYKPKCYYLRYGELFIGGYDPATDLPVDTDSWNIENVNETKRYIGDSELRWYSNGVFPQSILFNEFPRYWLNSEYDNSTTNQYLEVQIIQEPITKLKRREYDPEFISIYAYNDQQYSSQFSLRLKTVWTFVDGSNTTTYNFLTTNLQVNGMYTIDVGLTSISFDSVESTAGLRVLHYVSTIEIDRGLGFTDLSLDFDYKMDLNDEKDNQKRKVYFVNRFGAIEQFEFEGLQEESIRTNYNTYTKSLLNINFNERDRHIKGIIAKVPTRIYKINSGWLSLEQMTFLKSITKSNKAWWLTDFSLSLYFGTLLNFDGLSYEAINILDQDWQVDNKNKLFNLQLTIEVAQNSNLIK